jgi:hypothetical protein
MKLQDLDSDEQKREATSAQFGFIGLLVAAVLFLTVIGVLNAFNSGASRVLAAPEVFQDELRIDMGSSGFTPAEVQHAAGTFAIAVENSAITGEYTLRLKDAAGALVKEVQVQKGSAAWTVTLSAGEYTLTEANHPQWVCRIVVQ